MSATRYSCKSRVVPSCRGYSPVQRMTDMIARELSALNQTLSTVKRQLKLGAVDPDRGKFVADR